MTLRAQLEKWRPRERETVRIRAIDPESQEEHIVDAPAWLFRGERSTYPTTYSSYHRFSLSGLSDTAQKEVEAVTKRMDYFFAKIWFGSNALCGAFTALLPPNRTHRSH
jgi:hypothetical protein